MRTKVVKWGNSLGLRIPKSFAKEIHVAEGTTVDLVMEEGQLVIRVASPLVKSLDELLAEITDSNLHADIDTGNAVGDENW